jgi:hypothetical protein
VLDSFRVKSPNMHQLWPYRREFTWTTNTGVNDQQLVHLNDEFLDELRTGRNRPNIQSLSWPGL